MEGEDKRTTKAGESQGEHKFLNPLVSEEAYKKGKGRAWAS
jgi:hypothetical protein